MSSLAATQADGYYIPPEEYGRKKKRQRSEKDTIVRFELPHSGICTNCEAAIKRGTRYNATKKDTGRKYHSTIIWEFRMKCRACSQQEFVLEVDPQNRNFAYISGIRKQQGEIEAAEQARIERDEDKNEDILTNIEKTKLKSQQLRQEADDFRDIVQSNNRLWKNDAQGNARLRKKYRQKREMRREREKNEKRLGWSSTSLLDSTIQDEVGAKSVIFRGTEEKERWKSVRRTSIFDKSKPKRKLSRKTIDAKGSEYDVQPDVAPSSVSSAAVVTVPYTETTRNSPSLDDQEANTSKTLKAFKAPIFGQGSLTTRDTKSGENASRNMKDGLKELLPYGSSDDNGSSSDTA